MNKKIKKEISEEEEDRKFPLPVYDPGDDIYNKEKELSFDEFPDADEIVAGNENKIPGSGLDIPGSELDDRDERVGEEDEENNYYSLGGDDHSGLEEENTDLV